MLTPVVVRASYKITATELVVLETLLGINVPLLFPEVQVLNRTTAIDSVVVSGQVRNVFVNQPDPDFDGTVLTTPFASLSVGNGASAVLTGLTNSLVGSTYGITTEISLSHAGPAPVSLVTVVVKGMIETGVSPDKNVTINV